MIDGIILSFQLFSRIPLKKSVDFNSKNLNGALNFLPLLGLIMGGLTGLVVKLLINKSSLVAGALGFIFYLFISGGLHLDGLSDTADGFLSNASPEKILDIMKDSLIGSFGTLVLIGYSILKFSLYASMTKDTILNIGIASCIARLSSLYVISRGDLARPGGFGAKMKEALEGDKKIFLNGFLIGILSYYSIGSLVCVVVSLLVAELIRRLSTKKIGGLTGDVYGATIEINELVCLLILWGMAWI